ncbi:hypothetical protein CCACVL1_18226 [Corchorus capsularis]|uniref:Uncharacterized protein n=1 Tax=Corchorus capsularis TaxID=210143 RepID=A0A1R3HMC0_COCAP|nr:hypothetical protein CCACVL1_18226 [Corchorus capsularis]
MIARRQINEWEIARDWKRSHNIYWKRSQNIYWFRSGIVACIKCNGEFFFWVAVNESFWLVGPGPE